MAQIEYRNYMVNFLVENGANFGQAAHKAKGGLRGMLKEDFIFYCHSLRFLESNNSKSVHYEMYGKKLFCSPWAKRSLWPKMHIGNLNFILEK